MDQKTQQIKQQLLEQLISYMEDLDVDRIKGPQQQEKPEVEISVEGEEGPKVEVESEESEEPKQEDEQSDDEGMLAQLEEMYGKIKG